MRMETTKNPFADPTYTGEGCCKSLEQMPLDEHLHVPFNFQKPYSGQGPAPVLSLQNQQETGSGTASQISSSRSSSNTHQADLNTSPQHHEVICESESAGQQVSSTLVLIRRISRRDLRKEEVYWDGQGSYSRSPKYLNSSYNRPFCSDSESSSSGDSSTTTTRLVNRKRRDLLRKRQRESRSDIKLDFHLMETSTSHERLGLFIGFDNDEASMSSLSFHDGECCSCCDDERRMLFDNLEIQC